MILREEMERIYRGMPPDQIPWNLPGLPRTLRDLVERGAVLPGRTVDLGCGAGNHAVALAARGFEVTGVDLSAAAIEMAQARAREAGVCCRFAAADFLTGPDVLEGGFDFAYDWEVLHHVFPEDRPRYVRLVRGLLRPGGRYLSVCFSDASPQFGGVGKVRTTPLGTRLYFSSETELRDLFAPLFEVLELRTIEVAGRHAPHLANAALLARR